MSTVGPRAAGRDPARDLANELARIRDAALGLGLAHGDFSRVQDSVRDLAGIRAATRLQRGLSQVPPWAAGLVAAARLLPAADRARPGPAPGDCDSRGMPSASCCGSSRWVSRCDLRGAAARPAERSCGVRGPGGGHGPGDPPGWASRSCPHDHDPPGGFPRAPRVRRQPGGWFVNGLRAKGRAD